MRRLLWVGDAACASGFAECTHRTLRGLSHKQGGQFEVAVLGLNYRGDPHGYPYAMFPAFVHGGDLFGIKRLHEVLDIVGPDVIVIQNDPWNIPEYVKHIDAYYTDRSEARPTVVGTIAVDGMNCQGRALNGLDRVLFWTRFAQEEATRGGLTRPSSVVPLGVDLETYTPGDRLKARKRVLANMPPDLVRSAFIVGNINRNQPRKRLDLTVRYFGRWIRDFNITDAYLYLHVAPTGERAYDVEQLAHYYGFNTPENRRLIMCYPELWHGHPKDVLVETYRAFDAQLSTTQGEGWGLTTMEGMACGIPQIVPTWSALGEWCEDAAVQVPCTSTIVTPNGINIVGGIMDEAQAIEALDRVYVDAARRARYRQRGLDLVARDEYRWENIARQFAAEVEVAYAQRRIDEGRQGDDCEAPQDPSNLPRPDGAGAAH